MFCEPTAEHDWLMRLVGSWTFEARCVMGPDQPALTSQGTEVVRALGKLWVVGEGAGQMPGGDAMTSVITVGFDPAKKKFVGSWIGSCMGTMFVYEGELDRATNTLPLHTTGPSWADPSKTARYKDVVQLRSDDERVLTSHVMGDDGKWMQFMSAVYRRVKK